MSSRRLIVLVFAMLLMVAIGAVALGGRSTITAQQPSCANFPTQAAAQAQYRMDRTTFHALDPDNNGIACESNPCPCDTVRVTPTPTRTPTPTATPAATVTPTRPQTPPPPPAPQGWTRVTRVVDGDTFEVSSGHRVRLYGADAPDLSSPCGREAAAALNRMLTDNDRNYTAYLEYGPVQVESGITLAYLWVADRDAWYLLDEWMAYLGYAYLAPRDGQYWQAVANAEWDAYWYGRGCVWG